MGTSPLSFDMKKVRSLVIIVSISCCLGCTMESKPSILVDWETPRNVYAQAIKKSIAYLDTLQTLAADDERAKTILKLARTEFKRAEPYGSYLNPEIGHRTNGPALPIYLEDTGKVMKPFGLQKIEESIYEGEISQDDFEKEIRLTKGLLKNLEKNIDSGPLTAQRFFIATQQQLLRIVSHSISGFDTPVSHLGINETATSLENLREVYQLSIQNTIQQSNPNLNAAFHRTIDSATEYIANNQDFDTFDRYAFIREYLNPIIRNWTQIRNESNLWENVHNKPFDFEAPTFFEKNSFNEDYFTPITNRKSTKEQIALGKKLFHDPKLSEDNSMSCVTCHAPNKAFADGLVANMDKDGIPLQSNTPTLINSVFQKSFYWDGRSPTLVDQISSVFTNEKEFNSNVHQFSTDILKDSTYTKMFEEAYGEVATKNLDIIKAISSYVATLNGFNSKFDKNMRNEEDSFNDEERLGMNLFMGKALCATCHFMPLTNGTVPPFFSETEREVIGVPATADNNALDSDLGFYRRFKEELHYGMFKTPTVRNSELSAPYMHNGVYNTLEEVMDFYNKGGGGGMGFDLDHQTLPFDELNLTMAEQRAVVAFVKTLNDADVDQY